MIEGLIGLLGITLGALLSAFGYFLKLREEKLKHRKIVLFYLLEIRHVLLTGYSTTPEKMYQDYINTWNSTFKTLGATNSIQIPNTYQTVMKKHFEEVLKLKTQSLNKKFLSSFEEALNSLAQYDPIIAYQLKGNEILKQFLQLQNKYLKQLHNITDDDFISSFDSSFLNNIKLNEISDLIHDIDDDLKLISWKSGILSWWSCKKILNTKYSHENIFDPNDFKDIINKILNSIKKEV